MLNNNGQSFKINKTNYINVLKKVSYSKLASISFYMYKLEVSLLCLKDWLS